MEAERELLQDISIHSARVGGDIAMIAAFLSIYNFNPLRPCGRRQIERQAIAMRYTISIHSARVGGDP